MEGTVTSMKLYARRSSGLIRTIGSFGAMVFGVHCISLSSSGFIPFSWVASVWPGASIIGVLSIAAFLSLFHGYTYAVIGAAMPRSGADYTLASRVLNAPLAFAASWTLVIFSGIVAGGLIAWIPNSAFPALLQPAAILFQNDTFNQWAAYATSFQGKLIIGTVCVLITYVTMLMPTRTIVRILEIGFFLGVVAWVIIYFQLLSAKGPQDFIDAWNKFMASTSKFGAYDQRIPLAEKAGMVINRNMATMTLAGLIMGFWIFYGYYIPTFFAGEVKQASRTLLTGSWSSIIVTWAIFSFAVVLLQRLTPLDWISAEGYLSNNGAAVTAAAGEPVMAMPWITFYAGILKPNFWLVFITAIAWIYTLINLAQTYFFYASRIVFAWAFDRIIPDRIAYVHPKWGSPIVAITLIALVAEYGVYDAAVGGPLGTQLTFAFFAVVTQLVAVSAITLFPFLKPELFEQSPEIVKRRIGKVPLITLVGGITLLYLLWMIVASFLFPAVGVANPARTVPILLGMLASGLIIYYAARWYRMKREGIDIALTFKSVPPV
jgi:basic amino acid/polyamine antiporter, APA family